MEESKVGSTFMTLRNDFTRTSICDKATVSTVWSGLVWLFYSLVWSGC